MQRILLVDFSALFCLIVFPQAIAAQDIPIAQREPTPKLAPATLVTMAHRGYFNHQNIPGYLGFVQDYIFGRIGSERLVQAAVNDRFLPAEMIDDQRYLNVVRNQLESQLPAY